MSTPRDTRVRRGVGGGSVQRGASRARGGPGASRRIGRSRVFRRVFARTALMTLLALLWVFPVVWLLGKTFTPNSEILSHSERLLPQNWTVENIETVLESWPFLRWLFNSLVVTTGALVLTVVLSLFASFAFARLKWKGRDAVFLMFLASMFIPWEINAIPLYFVANWLNLLNTHPGIFLPISAMPIGMFLLRQFFVNIPQDLEDAARMDGAGSVGVLFRVLVPMALPAIGALVIWVFIFTWNEFFWSLIALQHSSMMTLPIGLKTIMGAQDIEYGNLFGASMLAMIPSLLVFLTLRRKIIEGISLTGSIK